MNDMRAPRTRNILEADAVAKAESNMRKIVMVRRPHSSGVCVVGMHENVQRRNLGDPAPSQEALGKAVRNSLQVQFDTEQEVGLLHSTVDRG